MAIPASIAESRIEPATRVRRRDPRELVTDQMRLMLEQRSVRFACIGVMLVFGSFFALVQTPIGVDTGWMFIVPVAISAIAGGMKEGLGVALVASALCAIYGSALNGHFEPALIMSVVSGRFALYGITAAFLGLFAEAHYSVQSNLRELAKTDPLTQVANVQRFYEELKIVERGSTAFALLVADVDDLKTINDRYGHQTGSAAIQTVARVLGRAVRSTDVVARYGGDEFVMILTEADRTGAQIVANRVRSMLAEERLPGAPLTARVGVSIGVALFGEDGTCSEDLLAVADKAMYEDKRARKVKGRKTVRVQY